MILKLIATILLTLCGLTQPRLIDIPLPNPSIQIDNSGYRWLGNQLYMLPVYGVCDAEHAHACVQYSYQAALLVFERHGQPFTVADLLAVTYAGELGLFNGSAISIEAVGRSALDTQTGACRWTGYVYDCQYANVIRYLYTSQHWRDSVVMSGYHVRVNIRRLLGGYARWLDSVPAMVQVNARAWRTGVGVGLPSVWGNTVGDTPPAGAYEWIVIESDGCTHVAFIVDTVGRMSNDSLGVC